MFLLTFCIATALTEASLLILFFFPSSDAILSTRMVSVQAQFICQHNYKDPPYPLQYIFEVAQRELRMRGMMQQIVATPIPKLFSCPHK